VEGGKQTLYTYRESTTDSGGYDATLLGILDCMLSSVYFVYQTIGWDYTVAGKVSSADQYQDWGLFNDPMLIGYITLRKKFIKDYDLIIRKHCDYLKSKLKDGKSEFGTSWWAPTPKTWMGMGILSKALSYPGTWLGKAIDKMCTWLTANQTAHTWSFKDYGTNENSIKPGGHEAVDPDREHGFSNFVAQHLDLYAGTTAYTDKWTSVLNKKNDEEKTIINSTAPDGAGDIQAACEVLTAYLNAGGDQKKVLEMILKLLPKLVAPSKEQKSLSSPKPLPIGYKSTIVPKPWPGTGNAVRKVQIQSNPNMKKNSIFNKKPQ
jgi:hypothetical protein